MAADNTTNQTYLEIEGMKARTEQVAQSDYSKDNIYSEFHPDALSDGDAKGKGTGNFGGHGWSRPDHSKPKGQMDYSNFNTSDGGDACDKQSRKVMTARSLYGTDRQYGIDIVPDTSLNVAEGQYDGSKRPKIAYVCPVV